MSLINPPIPATLRGAPVRVYGVTPDGRILIALVDGTPQTTIWESLIIDPEPIGARPTLAPAEGLAVYNAVFGANKATAATKPPEPWGEWTMHRDRTWGETWTRRRNHGTDQQYVRREQAGWCWRWVTGVSSGDGFQSADEARAACEGFTVQTEGVPVAPTEDEAAPEGEWSPWEPIRLQQLTNPLGLVRRHTDGRRQFISCLRPGKWRWHEARDGIILRDEQPFASKEAAIADCEAKTAGATSPPTDTTTDFIAELERMEAMLAGGAPAGQSVPASFAAAGEE